MLPDDVLLLFLPLAHSFAKVVEALWLQVGGTVAFVESLEKIVDNAHEVDPTVMPSVPRVFEKAYNAVVANGLASPGLKGKLFQVTVGDYDPDRAHFLADAGRFFGLAAKKAWSVRSTGAGNVAPPARSPSSSTTSTSTD